MKCIPYFKPTLWRPKGLHLDCGMPPLRSDKMLGTTLWLLKEVSCSLSPPNSFVISYGFCSISLELRTIEGHSLGKLAFGVWHVVDFKNQFWFRLEDSIISYASPLFQSTLYDTWGVCKLKFYLWNLLSNGVKLSLSAVTLIFSILLKIILDLSIPVRQSSKWQPTSVFSPRKSHGQRSMVGYSPQACNESNMTEQLST